MKVVLLVEDTRDLMEEVSDILEMEGFKVIVANSGHDALERLREVIPNIIITDLLMPGMDGFELIEKIRLDPSLMAIPIIILSAKTNSSDKKRGAIMGVKAFIGKPCKGFEIVAAVKSFC